MDDNLELKLKNLGDITGAIIFVIYPISTSVRQLEEIADSLQGSLVEAKGCFLIPDGFNIYSSRTISDRERETLKNIYHAIGEVLFPDKSIKDGVRL